MDSRRKSRLSIYPRYGPRESIFGGNSETYRDDTNVVYSQFLKECVTAMEDCCNEAQESQEILRQGTYDLPRMSKVLESERVFLLIDEATIRKYKADLTDEIEPQINELLSRAERGLKLLQKRENVLHTKVETAQQIAVPTRGAVNSAGMSKVESRRLQMLARQREHLQQELQALRIEVDDLELASMRR